MITEIESEKVLQKVQSILTPSKKVDETERISSNPVMVRRIEESRQQIRDGKGVQIALDDIWK